MAALSAIDLLRDRMPELPLGVAPNFVAVFALAFFWLSLKLPTRAHRMEQARRHFLLGLAGSVLGLCMWELAQIESANLVFDPADLLATGVGALAAFSLFEVLERRQTLRSG